MIKQKLYLLCKNSYQLSNSNINFASVLLLYSSQILKPDFNCCNRSVLSWVYKITIGTQSFISVIANVVNSQTKMRLISQSIDGISTVLQKLLKWFNDTIILASFILSALVLSVIFCLNLSEVLLSEKHQSYLKMVHLYHISQFFRRFRIIMTIFYWTIHRDY